LSRLAYLPDLDLEGLQRKALPHIELPKSIFHILRGPMCGNIRTVYLEKLSKLGAPGLASAATLVVMHSQIMNSLGTQKYDSKPIDVAASAGLIIAIALNQCGAPTPCISHLDISRLHPQLLETLLTGCF
jgi:hypothetical protein